MNEEVPLHPPYSTAHDHEWETGPTNPDNGLTEAVCACGAGIQFDGSNLEIRGGKLVSRV